MKIHLAEGESRAEILSEQSKILRPYILESFLMTTPKSEQYLPLYSDYMLDSGAFSMLMGNAKKVDLKTYVDSYIAYINKYDVQKFFELDIDPIIGYGEVQKIRNYIEKRTGKKPIPVWHYSRGKEEFIRMCENYPYVALGGLVGNGGKSGEYSSRYWKYFPWFIDTAHRHGAKIHGLGFTALKALPKYHFDSVDSTAWVSGNRFGHVYRFNGKNIEKYDKPAGMRVKNKEVALNNFIEWVKFQKYAETHY